MCDKAFPVAALQQHCESHFEEEDAGASSDLEACPEPGCSQLVPRAELDSHVLAHRYECLKYEHDHRVSFLVDCCTCHSISKQAWATGWPWNPCSSPQPSHWEEQAGDHWAPLPPSLLSCSTAQLLGQSSIQHRQSLVTSLRFTVTLLQTRVQSCNSSASNKCVVL